MIPNLSSDPALNTRPVYLVALTALALGLILAVVNLQVYLSSNRSMAEQIEARTTLQRDVARLEKELGEHLTALEGVPWSDLSERISAVNSILVEQQFSWSRLLADIGEVLPWQVRVISISPSAGDDAVRLSLHAVSRDRTALLEFLDNLVTSPRFGEPIPLRETGPEAGQSVDYLLTLNVPYLPHGEDS
jgi:Tfp pilus assembly protein PilN